MRPLLLMTVMLAIPAAADFDCDVTCPSGYKGGCVKSETGCHCSCDKQVAKVKEDLLKTLRDQGASGKVQDQAVHLMRNETSLKATTLKDEPDKRFTIFIKEY